MQEKKKRAYQQIRKVYKKMIPVILEYGGRCDPYFFDWDSMFTPIERNVWNDIRYLGVPLFPQYPVLNYFVDFGAPINKIAIEVDGKKWHKDNKKDLKRQREIEDVGWKIVRIPGKLTFKSSDDYYDEIEKYQDTEMCEQVLERVRHEYEQECSEGIIGKLYGISKL